MKYIQGHIQSDRIPRLTPLADIRPLAEQALRKIMTSANRHTMIIHKECRCLVQLRSPLRTRVITPHQQSPCRRR